jgi:hypothetical protein
VLEPLLQTGKRNCGIKKFVALTFALVPAFSAASASPPKLAQRYRARQLARAE